MLARWITIYSFLITNASLYIGGYVLQVFGVSVPVLRVAGGIVVTSTAWKLLNAKEGPTGRHSRPAAATCGRAPSIL